MAGQDFDAEAHFASLSEPELLAQELVQKGAIHVLEVLLARGQDPRKVLESLQRVSVLLTAELRRRRLPGVDVLET